MGYTLPFTHNNMLEKEQHIYQARYRPLFTGMLRFEKNKINLNTGYFALNP